MSKSTSTCLDLLPYPDKEALRRRFVGQDVGSLRTPALVVDRETFRQNCRKIAAQAKRNGWLFRAHVKTHKTVEGVRYQAEAAEGVMALIVSTMTELWQLTISGLVEEGLVVDILYSMPISADKLDDICAIQDRLGARAVIRLMVDNAEQVDFLNVYAEEHSRKAWSVFVKVDGGGRRAGATPESDQMKAIVQSFARSEKVVIFGFYSHFGQSYGAKSIATATAYLHGEVECVNSAATFARSLGAKGDWVLSVGATPTAHAAAIGSEQRERLEGVLELHAGCYCMNDLQQFSTSLIDYQDISIHILARVVSTYPLRDEALCDAGALAVSKDTGGLPGFGQVVQPVHLASWDLGRVSQEHGILVRRDGASSGDSPKVGDVIKIVPQHACLACACFPWLYVVDHGGDTVVDVWVPWKGW